MNRRPNNQQGPAPNNQDRQRQKRRRSGGNHQGGGNNQGGGERSHRPQDNQTTIESSPKAPPVLRRYAVVFYDNHILARDDAEQLQAKAKEVDQLNIVIKAEGSMDDPELLKYGKIYAGEAWHLIHRRRVDDKWYDEPHE